MVFQTAWDFSLHGFQKRCWKDKDGLSSCWPQLVVSVVWFFAALVDDWGSNPVDSISYTARHSCILLVAHCFLSSHGKGHRASSQAAPL
jgi:hypothetical protein